jgi:hypothetical protein
MTGSRGLGHDKYFHEFVTSYDIQGVRFRDFSSTESKGILRYRDLHCSYKSGRKEETSPHEHITAQGGLSLRMEKSLFADFL